MTLTASLNAQFSAQLLNTGAIANAQYSPLLNSLLAIALASGTGAGKVNQLYINQLTLAANADLSLSMYNFAQNGGAAATDPLGNALTLANVKLFIAQIVGNAGVYTETDYLAFGGDGTAAAWVSPFNANTDKVKLYSGTSTAPGTLIFLSPGAAGYAIVNATNHLLKIHNGGASPITFNLIVAGATA